MVAGVVAGLAACGENDAGGGSSAPRDPKAVHEAAMAALAKPVALISAFLPHLGPHEEKDRYAPKNRPELERAATAAANEIRHAANGVRQKLEKGKPEATKDLVVALGNISGGCTDASDSERHAKCKATVDALDKALEKASADAAAAGASGKYPRVSPESITDDARNELTGLLKARGPGAAEKDYLAKRGDEKVPVADLYATCQAAVAEAGDVQSVMERADEPIRLVAVTHKMSLESQCNKLNNADVLHREVVACKKTPTKDECKIACSKAQAVVRDGVPAAALLVMEKDVAEICKE
jgi:hypothetical protein